MRPSFALISILAISAACNKTKENEITTSTDTTNTKGIRILATTTIIADTLRSILPDIFTVESLMGPGVDPHLYRAKASDLSRLQRADLIVYNGLHLEGKLAEILDRQRKTKRAIAMSEGLPPDSLRYVGLNAKASKTADPHIWFDVSLWSSATQKIADRIAKRFSQHGNTIKSKSTRFLQTLNQLDSWTTSQIQKIPKKKRILVTAHDAFGYFGNRYGLRVVGVQGLSTSSEAGLADINRIVNIIKNNNVPTVFIESSVNPKQLKSIQQRLESTGYQVAMGAILYSDALGNDNNSDSYIEMIKLNTTRIVDGLNLHK